MTKWFIEIFRRCGLESIALLLILSLTWLGFGNYMAGLTLVSFLGICLFSKNKRALISDDKILLVLLALFTVNNIISSLLSIEPLKSTILSLVWFLIIFIPSAFVRCSFHTKKYFFERVTVPVSLIIALIIILFLFGSFLNHILTSKTIFGRYRFIFLGFASTPDTIVMLSGLGYGFLRQQKSSRSLWCGFIYLLICFAGMVITYDRGGLTALFFLSVLLLSFDYKRLIIFFILVGIVVFFIMKIKYFENLKYLFDFLYKKEAQKILWDSTQLATFSTAWQMIKNNWWLGVGTGNFGALSRQYGIKIFYTYAHNFILQFWAENGFFGMISALSIITLIIYRWLASWKLYKYKYIALGVGASFYGMLIGNLTNSTLWILKTALAFWFIAGFINAIYYDVHTGRLIQKK